MPTQAQLDELDAIIELLKAHPERHNQGVYARFEGGEAPTVTPALDCGSAFCVAGAAVARAGIEIVWQKADEYSNVWFGNHTTLLDEYGWTRSVSSVAAEVLGLTWQESDELFAADNSIEDIERIRASLTVTD